MDALRDVRVVAVTAQMAVMDFSPPFTAGSGENASSSVCTQLPNDKPITRRIRILFFSWSRKFKMLSLFPCTFRIAIIPGRSSTGISFPR